MRDELMALADQWRHEASSVERRLHPDACDAKNECAEELRALATQQPEAGEASDLLPRFKLACRTLIRERKVYGEDVETLGDVLKVIEAFAAQPEWVITDVIVGKAYSAFINAKVMDSDDTRGRLRNALKAAAPLMLSAAPKAEAQEAADAEVIEAARQVVKTEEDYWNAGTVRFSSIERLTRLHEEARKRLANALAALSAQRAEGGRP